MSTPLNSLLALHDYKKRFHQLHAALKNGLLAGIELGRELNKFMPSGLWKQEADTEEGFFQKNFPDWTPRYVRRLREAASYTDSLQLIVDRTGEPVNIPKTVEEAIDLKRKEKSKVVSREEFPSPNNTRADEDKLNSSSPKSEPKVLDAIGYAVPKDRLALWNRSIDELNALKTLVSRVKCAIEDGRAAEDDMFLRVHQDILPLLKTAYFYLQCAQFVYVCPYCNGHCKQLEQQCVECADTGLMTDDMWKRVRADVKEKRIKIVIATKPK